MKASSIGCSHSEKAISSSFSLALQIRKELSKLLVSLLAMLLGSMLMQAVPSHSAQVVAWEPPFYGHQTLFVPYYGPW
jgi:hypothetical protein